MLNRRFFLFGTAAAMAVARSAILNLGEEAVVMEATPAAPFYKRRLIHAIVITASADSPMPSRVTLAREVDGKNIIEFTLSRGDYVRWQAPIGCPLVQIPTNPIVLCSEGGGGGEFEVQMFYDEDGKGFVERHFFPRTRAPMQRIPMEA